MTDIGGFGVALITPFKKDGSIDFDALKNLIEYQIDGGINFLVVLGTTAETPTLSEKEQLQVLDFVLSTVNKRVPIVLGLGGNATDKLCKKIANFPLEDVDAILSVTPFYNRPSQEGLYAHYAKVAEVSPKPIILYNVPSRTGVNLLPETALSLASDFEGQIIGVKEASGSIAQVEKLIKLRDKDFKVLSGDDGSTYSYLTIGADGVISVIGNALPKEFGSMVALCMEGKFVEAMHTQRALVELYELLFADGNPSGVKSALHCMDLIDNSLRLPLVPCTPVTYSRIRQALCKFGYCGED